METEPGLHRLENILRAHSPLVVAFSGGVDSSFLLKFAFDALGRDNVLAVTGDSETLARSELCAAKAFAEQYGIRHEVIQTGETSNDDFLDNPHDRCFYCKNDLFGRLRGLADERGISHIADGTNADDVGGHRPGMKAAALHGVISPLADAELTKAQVREFSREMGLATWDKPAMACLASRIPHGSRITIERLSRVERAEAIIRAHGFANVRVRDHGDLARIEVDRDRIASLLESGIEAELKKLGFRFVTVDLEGFRSGSMSPA
ncbi:MAG: ATP-dependent sacrificial sulfur transferase LarE [Nitrospirae bacterium]|nr:ATP-dependent sacrificial sulfur transferase LarE [Nitrospirota bacterium]